MPGVSARLLVSCSLTAILIANLSVRMHAADAKGPESVKPGEPTDPKALKTWQTALGWLRIHNTREAIVSFRKAAKQDPHCTACMERAYALSTEMGNYKQAEEIAREWLGLATTSQDKATAHYRIAVALVKEGSREKNDKKEKCFIESCDELKTALELNPGLTLAHFSYGISLANIGQDDAARTEFSNFLQHDTMAPNLHERAQHYLDRVDLVRARMAPPFSITTLDGNHISLDRLAGKVVLIDFWATWCGPCREALPYIKSIANRYKEQPLVVISISLDNDESKWREFVDKNQMTWLQYRDGSIDGTIAKSFGVNAIPATFTIDADGVLEDQHVGDANIEGKLKKMLAAANANSKPVQPTLQARPDAVNTPEKVPAGTE
jgi:thiol-disulfide isomerase/thioredoxin